MEASDSPRPVPSDGGGPSAALPDERIAHNETVARSVNEAIEAGRVTRDGPGGFVCECGQLGCNAVVEMTLAEYETVRAHPRRFLLVAGHESRVEAVVADRGDYALVDKQGVAGRIAEATDPRAEGGT